jgi:hypothetical protein
MLQELEGKEVEEAEKKYNTARERWEENDTIANKKAMDDAHRALKGKEDKAKPLNAEVNAAEATVAEKEYSRV